LIQLRKLITIWFLFLGLSAYSQIVEIPLTKWNTVRPTKQVSFSVQSPQAVQQLPFWEDFSTSGLWPSESKWVNSENVRIGNSTGISAPTLNVAVFDGVDAFGSPYNPNTLINGKTDSLTSCFIDLSTLQADQADSLYLSFFWQLNGRGELPEVGDSIVLEAKGPDGSWNQLWSMTGGFEKDTEEFEQVLIKIEQDLWHGEFQFRFQAYTNLTGPFDTWLIDYIFLNKSRSVFDIAYLDRALTRRPSFLTAPYTAMPTEQFFSDDNKYVTETNSEFYNLNDVFQPIQYSTIVTDLVTGQEIERLNDNVLANPLPDAFERRVFESPALNPSLLNPNADSLLLETNYFITSGDTYFIENIDSNNDTTFAFNVDYRVNDTVRMVTVIDDYFAYDDGEPDFAAGINQRGGQLAYRFYAEERALLTHIDINFPLTQQAGEPIQLFVRTELDNRAESILYQNSYSVLRSENIGDLSSYTLSEPVFVQDTFFIGFIQATNNFLAVGLDKNNDSGSEMFFNVTGAWQRNEFVEGSFLMRPRFDKEVAVNLPGAAPDPSQNVKVYPNPSEGRFYIQAEATSIEVFDNYGNRQPFLLDERNRGIWVDLSGSKKGIYLLKFLVDGKPVAKRVVLSN